MAKRQPKLGQRVAVKQTTAYGEPLEFTGTVTELLSAQFIVVEGDTDGTEYTLEAGGYRYVLNRDDWSIVEEKDNG